MDFHSFHSSHLSLDLDFDCNDDASSLSGGESLDDSKIFYYDHDDLNNHDQNGNDILHGSDMAFNFSFSDTDSYCFETVASSSDIETIEDASMDSSIMSSDVESISSSESEIEEESLSGEVGVAATEVEEESEDEYTYVTVTTSHHRAAANNKNMDLSTSSRNIEAIITRIKTEEKRRSEESMSLLERRRAKRDQMLSKYEELRNSINSTYNIEMCNSSHSKKNDEDNKAEEEEDRTTKEEEQLSNKERLKKKRSIHRLRFEKQMSQSKLTKVFEQTTKDLSSRMMRMMMSTPAAAAGGASNPQDPLLEHVQRRTRAARCA